MLSHKVVFGNSLNKKKPWSERQEERKMDKMVFEGFSWFNDMEKRRCSPPEQKDINLKYRITDTAVHQHTAQKMKQGQLEKVFNILGECYLFVFLFFWGFVVVAVVVLILPSSRAAPRSPLKNEIGFWFLKIKSFIEIYFTYYKINPLKKYTFQWVLAYPKLNNKITITTV